MHRTSHNSLAFTLVEMLMAMSVMAIVAIGLATLATAVQETSEYTIGQGNAVQHARVTLERIERKCREAHATESFPGYAVFAESVGSYSFPDTLVVWSPASTPADPTGLPRFSELLIYFPNPSAVNELLEVTVPADSRTVPALTETATWQAELATIKESNTAEQVVLSDLLHAASTGSSRRGAVRFQTLQSPSASDLALYRSGSTNWSSLTFAQGVIDDDSGLAHHACFIELLMTPDDRIGEPDTNRDPVPFFGSAALHFIVEQ